MVRRDRSLRGTGKRPHGGDMQLYPLWKGAALPRRALVDVGRTASSRPATAARGRVGERRQRLAFWIEMRCEGRTRNSACPSSRDAGPIMDLFDDSLRSAQTGIRELVEEAKALGWRRTREGWTCPACQALMATGKKDEAA